MLESTILASPRVKLQTLIMTFAPTTSLTSEMWTIMAENGLKWGKEGWGGFSMANVVIYLNPKLSPSEAEASMAPLLEFGKRLQASNPDTTSVSFTEFPSWFAFFQAFSSKFIAVSAKPACFVYELKTEWRNGSLLGLVWPLLLVLFPTPYLKQRRNRIPSYLVSWQRMPRPRASSFLFRLHQPFLILRVQLVSLRRGGQVCTTLRLFRLGTGTLLLKRRNSTTKPQASR